MALTAEQQAFLDAHRAAAMVTLRADGWPHAVRVGVAPVNGRLWSSGTLGRLRTSHLRSDPRATLYIADDTWRWLTLECRVTILDGPDGPARNLQFFRILQPQAASGRIRWFGRDVTDEEFLQIMADEQRLIYEFDVVRAYGMCGANP